MDPLPPDPYVALGVSKDADAAIIKSTYRKLVLKCHPDKVTDESLKKQKQEEFHKIQQAYEIIGDDEKRGIYDAQVKLEQLRKEKAARGGSGPSVEVRTAHYDVRTAAPAGATFGARGPPRYEERKPSHRSSYDDDRYYEDRSSTHKYDTYDAYPKQRGSPRTARSSKEQPTRVERVSTDRSRSDIKKTRDREEKRERSGKFVYVEDESSSNDEKARFQQDYYRRTEEANRDARKRQEEERRRREEDEIRRQAADARKKAEEHRRHRSDDRDYRDERSRKLSDQEAHLHNYISRAKTETESRPSASRSNSYRDARPESHDSRSRRERERTEIRRSSAARPKEAGRDRERRSQPEIVEWDEGERKMPSFKHSSSSPADIQVPRMPQRSNTDVSHDHRRSERSPPPAFRRSETMPTVHSTASPSSSRKKENAPARSSGLRHSETVPQHDSGYSSPGTPETAYPTVPAPKTSTKYYYNTPGGGVALTPEEVNVANGHRTVLREPDSRRHRSPSPLTKPPMGANRPMEQPTSSVRYTTAAPQPPRTSTTIPPPLSRSATMNIDRREEERGRSGRLYGEVDSDYLRRDRTSRQTSFSPEKVAYARKIGPEDIRWSRGREQEYSRPSIKRHETYVY